MTLIGSLLIKNRMNTFVQFHFRAQQKATTTQFAVNAVTHQTVLKTQTGGTLKLALSGHTLEKRPPPTPLTPIRLLEATKTIIFHPN